MSPSQGEGHGFESRLPLMSPIYRDEVGKSDLPSEITFPLMTQDLYTELAAYTLSHPDPAFIHQHIVDAYAAQTADENTKPVKLVFGLIGLYLYLEKNYTGKQVQLMHMQLANKRKSWPELSLPKDRGIITIKDVLTVPAGQDRDEMIKKWCESVWGAYHQSHHQIRTLFDETLN